MEAAAGAQAKRGAALASDDYAAAARHDEALGAALEALRQAERAPPPRPVGWCEAELAAAKAASVVGTAKRCAALKTAIDAHAAKLTAMRNGNTAAAAKHEQDYARAVASVIPPNTHISSIFCLLNGDKYLVRYCHLDRFLMSNLRMLRICQN